MEMLATAVVVLLALYLAAGVLFALPFVLRGASEIVDAIGR